MNNELKIKKITSQELPMCFNELSKKPSQIFFYGDINLLKETCIAVIGMRDATQDSLITAREYGKVLAEQGYTVVNGIARGIDQAVISGVISARGKAVLVMPCSLDRIYPASAKTLVDKVIELGGCVISEYPSGSNLYKQNFIERDRLQAAIADKVVVVSSEEKGGTMATVKYTLNLNKPVACVINNSSGNQKLIMTRKGIGVSNIDGLMSFIKEPIPTQLAFAFN